MAKRRTKKDKVTAHHSYSLPTINPTESKAASKVATLSATDLIGYDPKFIYRDVLKTVLLSVLIIGAELALWWQWK
jgi:hypothetical protein